MSPKHACKMDGIRQAQVDAIWEEPYVIPAANKAPIRG
jgi:hypothetical protein